MITFFVISIILGSVLYILWPLWHIGQLITNSSGVNNGQLEDLFDQQNNLLVALLDLEADHHMGKISSDDFENLQNNYQSQAIQVLKQIDQLGGGMFTSTEMNQLSSNNGDHRESSDEIYCISCRTVAGIEDSFCTHCGKQLS